MRRTLLLLSLATLLALAAHSQRKGGRGYIRGGLTLFLTWTPTEDEPYAMGAFTAVPGFKLVKGRVVSVVMALPVSVGVSLKEFKDQYIGLDVPAMLELHFGSATGTSRKGAFGLMLGGGAGFTSTIQYDYDRDETRAISFFGMRFNGGVVVMREASGNHVMITASYGRNFNGPQKYSMSIGIAAAIN